MKTRKPGRCPLTGKSLNLTDIQENVTAVFLRLSGTRAPIMFAKDVSRDDIVTAFSEIRERMLRLYRNETRFKMRASKDAQVTKRYEADLKRELQDPVLALLAYGRRDALDGAMRWQT